MTNRITLELPWPPSVNHYWGTSGKRRYIMDRGLKFRQTVGEIVKRQRIKTMTGRVSAKVMAYPPDRRRRDLDNLMKAVFDAIEHAGVYVDDNQIDYFSVQRCQPEKPGRVVVEVYEKVEGE